MWAGSVTLRLGAEQQTLVGLSVDTETNLARVRALLSNWIDDSSPVVAAFGLILDPEPHPGEKRGVRSIPQLRFGSRVLYRSRDEDAVLEALAFVLGGLHEDQNWSPSSGNNGDIWLSGLRLFAGNGKSALVSAERPALVGSRTLERAGIVELPCWALRWRPDGSIMRPPVLSGLNWAEAGSSTPASTDGWQPIDAVVLDDVGSSSGERLTKLLGHCSQGEWFAWSTLALQNQRISCVDELHTAELLLMNALDAK